MGTSFRDKPFLMEKEARFGMPSFFKKVRTNPKETAGNFVNTPGASTVTNHRMFDESEVVNRATGRKVKEGTGSFTADAFLGLTKKIAPGTKAPIENAVAQGKKMLENADTKAGAFLAGKDPSSFRGKVFSSKVQREVGEATDGTHVSKLLREDRRPSLVAPVQKTTQVAAPLLGAMYVAEKMYPNGSTVDEPPHQSNVEKVAFEEEKNKMFEEVEALEMDKIASMQKIAELEGDLEKYATQVSELMMEKQAMEKRLQEKDEEVHHFQKKASQAETSFLEKQAEHDELRLRTIAKLRSKTAVELADQMLEVGLVKQARLNEMVDELMECDESKLKIYQDMISKRASEAGESLESLSILGEYKNNEKLASSSKTLAEEGLSRKGQSIEEAARDLLSK